MPFSGCTRKSRSLPIEQEVGVPPVRGQIVYLFCVRKSASLCLRFHDRNGGTSFHGAPYSSLCDYDEKHSPLVVGV